MDSLLGTVVEEITWEKKEKNKKRQEQILMKINFVYVGTDLSRKFEMTELIPYKSNKDATGGAPCYI